MTNRREFIVQLGLGAGVLASSQAFAQDAALSETDPAAVAQGYKADSTKVDAKKFPKHAATQTCANCALFQGKAGAASGPCGLFPKKEVSAKGWCQAWVKKA